MQALPLFTSHAHTSKKAGGKFLPSAKAKRFLLIVQC